MSVFFDIFQPGRRHVDDERNRLEWTRDEEGEGEPDRGPIDLESGVVTIRPTAATQQAAVTNPPVTEAPAPPAPATDPAVTRPAVS
jgi:hypothetical protein